MSESSEKAVAEPRRKYLPAFADLADRLSIVLQKMIFIPEQRATYEAEAAAIMHDIDIILDKHPITSAEIVRALQLNMLANRYIWENEAWVRAGEDKSASTEVKYKRLKGTHSINGVRNSAKNVMTQVDSGRQDYKIDCLAAELVEELGDWNILSRSEA